MAASIGQKHKNGFKIVEIWDNHSESLKNNLYNDFKGPEHLLGGMNLENEIDTCQTTVPRKIFLIEWTKKICFEGPCSLFSTGSCTKWLRRVNTSTGPLPGQDTHIKPSFFLVPSMNRNSQCGPDFVAQAGPK